ncbi:MAG: YggS family pyridoxal phosphate-dependent enzyme [Planctomycetaceae bacterium]
MDLQDRVARVKDRIAAATARAGQPGRPVTIVAVTKGRPAFAVDALAASGLVDIGENRVQEALAKAPDVSAGVRWHLVGHLQRNKARKAAALFSTIHSVDSAALLDALAPAGRPLDLFLQISISGEATKHGVPPAEAPALLAKAFATPPLRPIGLMTVAPYAADPESARPTFRELRRLLRDLNAAGIGPPLDGLSMGMSGEFEIAVEEGATHVRIGTALLG